MEVRMMTRMVFLMLFIALLITGKVQAWMAVFAASAAAAVLFGRFYCGFICPANTLIECAGYFYKKAGTVRRKVPGWAKQAWVKYGMLVLFIMAFAFSLKTGRKLPVLPVLTGIGFIVSMFFVPALWHRYLCPYGTILSIPGSLSKYFRKVDPEVCSGCGACIRACPAEAALMGEKKAYAEIRKGLCIECGACTRVCPRHAINYK